MAHHQHTTWAPLRDMIQPNEDGSTTPHGRREPPSKPTAAANMTWHRHPRWPRVNVVPGPLRPGPANALPLPRRMRRGLPATAEPGTDRRGRAARAGYAAGPDRLPLWRTRP